VYFMFLYNKIGKFYSHVNFIYASSNIFDRVLSRRLGLAGFYHRVQL